MRLLRLGGSKFVSAILILEIYLCWSYLANHKLSDSANSSFTLC